MQAVVYHATIGNIGYDESFWTGRKTLSINANVLKKLDRKTYLWFVGSETKQVKLLGNYLWGVKIIIDGETIEIVPKMKWYELILYSTMLAFFITWGNNAKLCSIFPLIGGAVGGGITAALTIFSMILMKKAKRVWVKLLIWFVFFAGCFIISFVLAILAVILLKAVSVV